MEKSKSSNRSKSKTMMIYVTPGQLDQVEYIFQQSMGGNHILFDTDRIKNVFRNYFKNEELFNATKLDHIHNLLSELINKPSLESKRDFLSNLNDDRMNLLIMTYFNIIENNIVSKEDHLQ